MEERYQDVKDLIFQGFLLKKAKVNGVDIVFKSISHEEFTFLEKIYGTSVGDKTEDIIRFNIFYIIYSIYSIQGVSVLRNREVFVEQAYSVLKDVPYFLFKKILKFLNGFNTQISEAYENLEAFTYEDNSRFKWKLYKTVGNSFERIGGLSGTDSLVLNAFQENWMIFNTYEDEKIEHDKAYSLAKFAASAHDPKSIKKIDAADRAREDEETARRDHVKNKKSTQKRAEIVNPVFSSEELMKQLDSTVTGNYDGHDAFMEKFDRAIISDTEKYLKEQNLIRQKKINEINEIYKSKEIDISSPEDLLALRRWRKSELDKHPVAVEGSMAVLKRADNFWNYQDENIKNKNNTTTTTDRELLKLDEEEFPDIDVPVTPPEKTTVRESPKISNEEFNNFISSSEIQKLIQEEGGTVSDKIINKFLNK